MPNSKRHRVCLKFWDISKNFVYNFLYKKTLQDIVEGFLIFHSCKYYTLTCFPGYIFSNLDIPSCIKLSSNLNYFKKLIPCTFIPSFTCISTFGHTSTIPSYYCIAGNLSISFYFASFISWIRSSHR